MCPKPGYVVSIIDVHDLVQRDIPPQATAPGKAAAPRASDENFMPVVLKLGFQRYGLFFMI